MNIETFSNFLKKKKTKVG